MSKTCHACNAEVPETHQGKCPSCGKKEGYKIVLTINEMVDVSDLLRTKLEQSKINPKTISFTIDTILTKQKELQDSLAPIAKIIYSSAMQNIRQQINDTAKATQDLQSRLSNIKIPVLTSSTETKEDVEISEDDVDEAVEKLEEINEETSKKELETNRIETQLKDMNDTVVEQHTEQMQLTMETLAIKAEPYYQSYNKS